MTTLSFSSHTQGMTVEDEVKNCLAGMLERTGSLNGMNIQVGLTDDQRRPETKMVLAGVVRDSVLIRVPLLSSPPNRSGYKTYVATLKPPQAIEIGAFATEVRKCLALHASGQSAGAEEPGKRSSHLNECEEKGSIVPLCPPRQLTEAPMSTDPKKQLAVLLLAIHQQNSTVRDPQPATKIIIKATGDTRHPSAVSKRLESLVDEGFLTRTRKQGLIWVYVLTEQAVALIKEQLGEEISVSALASPTGVMTPAMPEMSFEEALAQLLAKKRLLEESVTGLGALREEILGEEAQLNEKKARLREMEKAEIVLQKLAKQLTGLIS